MRSIGKSVLGSAVLLGDSETTIALRRSIDMAARSSAKVLILGETGVGKEVVARSIHDESARRGRPFVAVNCSGIPETLLESELFGHVRGSFTGAYRDKPGVIRQAHGGTLFLDELGEMSPRMQAVLLRFTESGEMHPVGADAPAPPSDVRLITATNRDLRAQIEGGTFRQDLYYRLNVIEIRVLPLRERHDDITVLLRHYLERSAEMHNTARPDLTASAEAALMEYSWPGNIRQLRNLVESMVVLSPGHEITAEDIPREIREGAARFLPVPVGRTGGATERAGEPAMGGRELEFIIRSLVELKLQVEELRRRVGEDRVGSVRGTGPARDVLLGEVVSSTPPVAAIEPTDQPPAPNEISIRPGMSMAEIERAAIELALRETRGNRRKAADMLGIGERTLYRKLKEYNLPEYP